jgi:hypothetical protein
MEDTPAYRLDINGLDENTDPSSDHKEDQRRPWVGIRFDCCGVYTRIYRNPEATAYAGQCPRCGKKVRLKVGDGGTDSRFFVAE